MLQKLRLKEYFQLDTFYLKLVWQHLFSIFKLNLLNLQPAFQLEPTELQQFIFVIEEIMIFLKYSHNFFEAKPLYLESILKLFAL